MAQAAKANKPNIFRYFNKIWFILEGSIYEFYRSTSIPMRQLPLFPVAAFLAFGLALSGCKKEVEVLVKETKVEVEKKYSWSEHSQPKGSERIILSLGTGPNSLFMQQPESFSTLIYRGKAITYTSYSAGATNDLRVRVPITERFFPAPLNDSVVVIYSTLNPNETRLSKYIRIKQLDPTVTHVLNTFPQYLKFGAINRNGYLLFAYENSAPGRPLTFVLSQVQVASAAGLPLQATSRRISIPRNPSSAQFFRNITAIEYYFLVAVDGAGIYKIKQDGSVQLVDIANGRGPIDAFYKWKGRVYAIVEHNEIMVSDDDGVAWTRYFGLPGYFSYTSYHVVRDSLVGVSHPPRGGVSLFTLRWDGLRYFARFLKDDGLSRAEVTDLQQLQDSVYVATTSGLFVQPVSTFFETKK